MVQSILFYKNDKFYSIKQKYIHLALIWLVPFIWSFLLKELGIKAQGSHHYDKTKLNLGEKGNNEVDALS